MIKNEWTTEEVLQDITKQLENKEKNIDLLRTRIRSKIRRIEKLCTSNKKLHEENTRLKENIHSMLFTDDVVQDRYDKAKEENTKLKELLKEAEKVIWEVMDCREDREFYRDLADEYYTKRSKMK